MVSITELQLLSDTMSIGFDGRHAQVHDTKDFSGCHSGSDELEDFDFLVRASLDRPFAGRRFLSARLQNQCVNRGCNF